MAVPLLLPLHVTDTELAVRINALGSETFHETDDVQPEKSVIVAVYDPAHNPVMALSVCPVFHVNE